MSRRLLKKEAWGAAPSLIALTWPEMFNADEINIARMVAKAFLDKAS